MTDREKVINALGRCESYGYCEDKRCPYYEDTGCLESMRKDALELLKEQDPVKPIRLENWWKCPSCSGNIVANMKYCPRCGRAVKWDA